jgi:site-specific DNA recombinase
MKSQWQVSETECVLAASARLKIEFVSGFSEMWTGCIRPMLRKIVFHDEGLRLVFLRRPLREFIGLPPQRATEDGEIDSFELAVQVSLRTRGRQIKLLLEQPGGKQPPARPDASLLRALARAHRWFDQLKSGEADSIASIAATEQVTGAYVTRVLRLAFLAPSIVETILDGTQPPELSADRLMLRTELPLDWGRQRSSMLAE